MTSLCFFSHYPSRSHNPTAFSGKRFWGKTAEFLFLFHFVFSKTHLRLLFTIFKEIMFHLNRLDSGYSQLETGSSTGHVGNLSTRVSLYTLQNTRPHLGITHI